MGHEAVISPAESDHLEIAKDARVVRTNFTIDEY